MQENSVEFLGQKFSYPSTWPGAFSVLVVCASITTTIIALSPEQIDSFSVALGMESDKKIEKNYLELNKKLIEEFSSLKKEVKEIVLKGDVSDEGRDRLLTNIEESDKSLDNVFTENILEYTDRVEFLRDALESLGARVDDETLMAIEAERELFSEVVQQLENQKALLEIRPYIAEEIEEDIQQNK